MKKQSFIIRNQAGVQATIKNDGIWIEINDMNRYFRFPEKITEILDENWFFNEPNTKAYLSISGSFIYLIINYELWLITLASDKNGLVFCENICELFSKGSRFHDANFSYEETILYGLTDSNRIILFSLLPTKKIKEYIFNWDFECTHASFELMVSPPPEGFDSNNIFLIEKKSGSQVEKRFFGLRKDEANTNAYQQLVLQPIREKNSLFQNYDDDENDEDEDDNNNGDDDADSPTTKEEAAKLLMKKGKQLQKYEKEIIDKKEKINERMIILNRRYKDLRSKADRSKKRFEGLFTRIERLIEAADAGISLVHKSEKQKHSQEILESLDRVMDNKKISYTELEDDIVFDYRSLERMIGVLHYNIDLLLKSE